MASKTIDSKKFLLYFFGSLAGFLLLIALFVYILDPFFQYRIRDDRYILNPIYNNVGLAKNYDYNTAIIGSSMTQNYDLSILERDSLIKPVKLASGAMTIDEMQFLYNQTNQEKTNRYIISLDMIQFNEWLPAFRYPSYLFEGGILDRLQYFYAYESTLRYGLTDLLMVPYMTFTKEEDLPQKVKFRTHIDDIGNFSLDAVYNDAERIKRMYHSGQTISYANPFEMNVRMKSNIDNLLRNIDLEKNKDKEYTFILPPYSALYWHITKEDQYFYNILNNIKYLCRATEKYDNVRIQFYYNLDEITDLARYSDVTHFDPQLSNFILENRENDQYRITTENMDQWLKDFDDRIIQYRVDNQDWINN